MACNALANHSQGFTPAALDKRSLVHDLVKSGDSPWGQDGELCFPGTPPTLNLVHGPLCVDPVQTAKWVRMRTDKCWPGTRMK